MEKFDYPKMKGAMEQLIGETQISKLVEKQDARLNARENKLKASKKRMKQGSSINPIAKTSPRKKTNYFSKDELKKEFPTFRQ